MPFDLNMIEEMAYCSMEAKEIKAGAPVLEGSPLNAILLI